MCPGRNAGKSLTAAADIIACSSEKEGKIPSSRSYPEVLQLSTCQEGMS